MNILTDTHCHTLASSHAYSTVKELIEIAAQKKLEAIAVTDHGIGIPDAPHLWHFENLHSLPREIDGVRVLRGVEANIKDDDGSVDMPDYLLKRMDIVLASIHEPSFFGTKGLGDYTDVYLKVLDNPYIDIIAHSGSADYPYIHDDVLLKAKKLHKLIEINNHSFFARKTSIDNCRQIAIRCKELGVGIAVNTDAHICYQVGEFTNAINLLKEIDFPEKLIINRSFETLKNYLSIRKVIGE